MSGGTGLAKPSPVVRIQSLLVPRHRVEVTVDVEGETVPIAETPETRPLDEPPVSDAVVPFDAGTDTALVVPLIALAIARSGDKGDSSNIAVIAREARFFPLLDHVLTADAVGEWMSHVTAGPVVRYRLPRLDALNFVLPEALGGGGVASLRFDPQGKAFAAQLLDMPITIPRAWLDDIPEKLRA